MKNRYVIGIDQGLSITGLSVFDTKEKKIVHVVDFKTNSKESLQNRLFQIKGFLNGNFDKFKNEISYVVTERLSTFGNRIGGVMNANLVTAIILLVSEKRNIPVHIISPMTVKKQVTGSGKATKEEIINFINENKIWTFDHKKDNHKADAIILSMFDIKK